MEARGVCQLNTTSQRSIYFVEVEGGGVGGGRGGGNLEEKGWGGMVGWL